MAKCGATRVPQRFAGFVDSLSANRQSALCDREYLAAGGD
jgi:hypothetical protein